MSPQALDGIRVLDLTNLTGAYTGKLLADMGAEVIRIAPPLDHHGPFVEQHYNGGKAALALDLGSQDGWSRFAELAREADVVLETSAPGTFDWARLRELAPHLVVASLTPFGQSGPYCDWRTSDTVAQAMGGMLYVNGHADEAPLRGFGLQAYHSAATYTAIAVMLALLGRARSGRGQHIDVSLQACVAATVEHVSGTYDQNGGVEERRGSLHWSRYFRVGRARDGHVMHCTLGDWTSLIEWVKGDGKAEDLADPVWDDFLLRKANCEHLFDVLDRWAKSYDVAELVEGAQLRRVPYAPVLEVASLAQDPQLRDRGFFVDDDRGAKHAGAPYVFGGTPWQLATSSKFQVPSSRFGSRSELGTWNLEPGTSSERTRDARPETILSGIRVVDFTWVVAGPVATRILGDQGAEVIKIERRGATDFGTRRGGLSGNLNRGKQSIVVDMTKPEGLAVVRELIAKADVVIDNFSARVMPNFGLDYESLRQSNPGIIAISMSGFGRTGPYRDYVSYGPTLQALTGFTSIIRHPGSEPAGWGFSYSDMAGGYSAALAVLIALWHRRRTGEGQFIDLAQFEALAALLGAPLLEVLNHGTAIEPLGNRSPEGAAAPHGVYRCADRPPDAAGARTRDDRWCAITAFGEPDWARFVDAIGQPPWTREARFATLAARLANQDALDANVEEWTRVRTAEDVMHTLQAAGVAAGIVADAEDLCVRDRQLRHRGYWVEVDTPEGARVRLDGVPFTIDGVTAGPRQPGPLLGEHTDEILRRVLGMSDERIALLRASEAIG